MNSSTPDNITLTAGAKLRAVTVVIAVLALMSAVGLILMPREGVRATGSITLEISCTALIGTPYAESQNVPANGLVLYEEGIAINSSDTVFDMIARVSERYELKIEYVKTDEGIMIASINGISGADPDGENTAAVNPWTYRINGGEPIRDISETVLSDGDSILFTPGS